MRNLNDMNHLYNVQDVILLLEIVENRFEQMYQKNYYNPRKCNSASTLCGCIQRDLSQVIIALPMSSTHIESFEKTVTGRFSCVKNRLVFDTVISLPNLTQRDFNKMNIDESFHAFKRDDLKLCYRLKLDEEENYSDRGVITKILKLDDNNQYVHAMTKPIPVRSIKEKPPDWAEFDLLLEKVTLGSKIVHLFIVDIEFDNENADAKQAMYNEIYPL